MARNWNFVLAPMHWPATGNVQPIRWILCAENGLMATLRGRMARNNTPVMLPTAQTLGSFERFIGKS